MKTLSNYRAEARKQLSGNWLSSALFVFVYMLVTYALGSVSLLGGNNRALSTPLTLLGIAIAAPLEYGACLAFLKQARGEEMQIGHLFSGYNMRTGIAMILKMVYTLLWMMLLIVPGIVKNYSYAMTSFILADNPDMTGEQAICRSMEMMKGNKLRLFKLDLIFAGWLILTAFTLFIGIFWLESYILQTRAAFYEDLKAEESVEAIEEE